jgi:hypothetical protein
MQFISSVFLSLELLETEVSLIKVKVKLSLCFF